MTMRDYQPPRPATLREALRREYEQRLREAQRQYPRWEWTSRGPTDLVEALFGPGVVVKGDDA
jgi:hypothetical protein